jgi:hypothetical protein
MTEISGRYYAPRHVRRSSQLRSPHSPHACACMDASHRRLRSPNKQASIESSHCTVAITSMSEVPRPRGRYNTGRGGTERMLAIVAWLGWPPSPLSASGLAVAWHCLSKSHQRTSCCSPFHSHQPTKRARGRSQRKADLRSGCAASCTVRAATHLAEVSFFTALFCPRNCCC